MSVALDELVSSVQPMSETDIDRILEIEGHAYPFPWSKAVFQDCLRVGYCCWVIKLQRLIEAYGIMSIATWEAHILNLCVNPGAQRSGLGTMMLDHLCNVASDHRAERIFLEVRPSNEPAIRLYQRAGFQRIGLRKGYYPRVGGREDAFVLALDLSRSRSPSGQRPFSE